MPGPAPRVGVVVLTQGRRPEELAAGIRSVLTQAGVEPDVVVVGNGWDPATADPALPEGIRTLHLPENLGIPAGRNRGVPLVSGEWLAFLDDDAAFSPGLVAGAIAKMRAEPSIGLVQPRVDDEAGGPAPRRWIPRIRKGDPARSSNVFSCWEGALVMPRAVFEAAGGWGDPYFYAHEGVELAWRVWDAGYRAWYAGDLAATHPVIRQTRHSQYWRLNARNRVWLAKRNLPWLIAPVYVASWTLLQQLRFARNPAGFRAWWAGWREGWRVDPGGRRRMRWRTVWRMTLAGRPPLV
ncbi:glycosyltransferase family 2 protein [Agromyces archimandritae]|uniref:Glycosyltransferase family 2 protein n=1 Tax=Agromyces archimandritae TaxID=2781962 RepID=A0A975FPQ3_9MICO|nr:glycosyltransferase family 2 protein [Agromyces archimandritae]QTX06333.1 glycosyltransferase family 2 protein [Agromyces archimandritae]